MRCLMLILFSALIVCSFAMAGDHAVVKSSGQAVAPDDDGFVLVDHPPSYAPSADAFLAGLEVEYGGSDDEGSDDVVVSVHRNDLTSSGQKSKEKSRLNALRDQFCHGANAIAKSRSAAARGAYSAFHLLKHVHEQARCELPLTQLVQGKHNPSGEYKLSLDLMKAACLWHRNRGIFVENVGREPLLSGHEIREGSGGDQSNDGLRLFLLANYFDSPPLELSGPFCAECEGLIVYDFKSALGKAAYDAAAAVGSVAQEGCDHVALALAATAALVPDHVVGGGVGLVVSAAEVAARLAGLL